MASPIQNIMHRAVYISGAYRWFYVQEPTREVSRPIQWGGGGAGAYRNLVVLLGPLRCTKKLNRPARAAPPITKLIRNQEEIVRHSICASCT
jgi:hypothetical protein